MIVTIDGPAGAGKSSAARVLARELGFEFLDTGAMYRAVTWAAMDQGINLQHEEAAARVARAIDIQFEGERVFVNGQDVSKEIRSQDVTRNIAPIADNPKVREILVGLQRKIARYGNFVCEGRDQGTVAFPEAECKIFLTASPEHRARRRVLELERQDIAVDYGVVLREQTARDLRDTERPVGRLQKADDAIEVMTDNLTLEEVVRKLKDIALSKMAANK